MEKHCKWRTLFVAAAAVFGGLVPFRPFFFTRPTDPTTETVDLFLCPAYILARFLPPMGDSGSLVVFVLVIAANSALYYFAARALWIASRNLTQSDQDPT